MKKIATMLLTLLFTLSIAFSSFAQTYPLSAASVTPPSRFSNIKKTEGNVVCRYIHSLYSEQLNYRARPVDSVRKAGLNLEYNVSKKYEITSSLKKFRYGNGKTAFYFGFESTKTYTYGIIILVPVSDSTTVFIADTISTRQPLGSFPFSTSYARKLAETAKRRK